MQLGYADRELERQCTDERYMQRKLGAQVAKALKLRITELRYATEMKDLLLGTGRWEELSGDRSGQWSARLYRELAAYRSTRRPRHDHRDRCRDRRLPPSLIAASVTGGRRP